MIVCVVVFFFKQKTAYEMRISDWSSDVCSSDLSMWNKSSRLSGTVVRIFAIAASMALLAGCASTISARVTSFQQWPSDASGQDYRIVPAANQVNNLEFESIADTVRAEWKAPRLNSSH